MGVRVSKLTLHVDEVAIKVGPDPEDVVNVSYRPGALTLGALERLQEMSNSGQHVESIAEMLKPILVTWDLLDENDNPLPIDYSGLSQVPIEFLGQLIDAISGTAKVDPDEGKVLGVISQPEDPSVTPLTGTSSSEPQTT